MEVCIFWVNRRVFNEVTVLHQITTLLSPCPESLSHYLSVLVLLYRYITLLVSLIQHLISDPAMPHAAVKCFCVCQSFPFPLEDFHHLLCTSWWVASSVSKSTQIENEQHPSQPQTWNRSAVGERTTLWGRAGRTDPCDDTSLPPDSFCLSEWFMSEKVNRHPRNWMTSLTALLQLCRLLRAACLHKASCGSQYSNALAVHAVLFSVDAFPWSSLQLLSEALRAPLQMRRDGRDENPESVEQWDIGFKSFMAISKDFYSWCCAHYICRVSSTELECNSKSRFVSHPIGFCPGRRKLVKALMSLVCSPCLLIVISCGDEESRKNEC